MPQQQQQSLWDRLLENPLVIAILGTLMSMYLIGTLEERRQRRDKEKDPSSNPPPFIGENEKELWGKFRELYRQEMSNPDKVVEERLELLTTNLERMQSNIEELLDRTEPSHILENEEKQEAEDAKQ